MNTCNLTAGQKNIAILLAEIAGRSFAPLGPGSIDSPTDSLRRGLHSCAAMRLFQRSSTLSTRTRASGSTRSIAALTVLFVLLSGCSKEPAAKEPIVPVQVAPVEKTTIEHTVVAEGVLFPLAQSAIVPKI